LAGRTFVSPAPYTVSREKIADFCGAVGADPIDGGETAPVTFPIVVAFAAMTQLINDPDIGIQLHNVVHGEQRFDQARPIRAGDELTATLTVDRRRDGHDRHPHGGSDHGGRTGLHGARPASASRGWDMNLAVGDELDARSYPVTRADLIRYAGASGDFNAIHWSDRVADSVGLPGVIAHGMYTLALAGRAVASWVDDPAAVESFGARFTKPVSVPDDDDGTVVDVAGVVKAVDTGKATIELTVTNAGTKVLGMCTAVVRC